MAMTVTESSALNRLLDWIFGVSDYNDEPITSEEARKSAEVLARSANKRLMAGYDAASVRELWERIASPPAQKPARRKASRRQGRRGK